MDVLNFISGTNRWQVRGVTPSAYLTEVVRLVGVNNKIQLGPKRRYRPHMQKADKCVCIDFLVLGSIVGF